jgi:sugar lactone lactonase YvrE
MKTRLFFILVTVFYTITLFAQNKPFQSDKLEKIWEVSDLSVPESVLPVPEEGILYVSNIGTNNPIEKDAKGFISILTTDGKIKILKWSADLNSPKGMAISNGKLYVTEVDRIAEIDLKTGKKLKDYPVNGAKFLNDIAVDKTGVLYISDSQTGTVHKLENGIVSILVQSDSFPSPNGLFFRKDILLLGTGDKIVTIDPATKEVSDCMINTGAVDGLAVVGPGMLIFSDWPGTIHIMKKDEEKELLLDTTSSETAKTADFGYIADKKLIFIPTFFDNSVVCYKLKID